MTVDCAGKRNRQAAWLAIFAMLIQSLLPAVHHPASMALAAAPAFWDPQHLCLAPGSFPAAPGHTDKAPAHHAPACDICQAVHAIGGFAPPSAPICTHEPAVSESVAQNQQVETRAGRHFPRPQPRAPPLIA